MSTQPSSPLNELRGGWGAGAGSVSAAWPKTEGAGSSRPNRLNTNIRPNAPMRMPHRGATCRGSSGGLATRGGTAYARSPMRASVDPISASVTSSTVTVWPIDVART